MADQVKKTVDAVRGDASAIAQDFFVYYIRKSPGDLAKFPKYVHLKDDLGSLPSVSGYADHVTAVLEAALCLFEVAHDAGALGTKASAQVQSHVARKVGNAEFGHMLDALSKFLSEKLGGAHDAAAWNSASAAVLAALN